MAQHIQLSLDPNVVPNWGLWEAVREILQGAIDSGSSYDMMYDADRQTIRIVNDGKLSKASLLIGYSTKRGDSSKIGQHGEGYKLAAAVLLREKKPFSIYNDGEVWNFSVRPSRWFKADIVQVSIASWFIKETGTILWEVGNITPEEYEQVKEKVQVKGDIEVSPHGYILLDKPGQIFAGGLFVCHNKKLSYGYNFHPGVLSLQRDRNIVSDFDIFWLTSKCWVGQPDLAVLMRDDVADVVYASSQYNKNIQSASEIAYDLFRTDYGKDAVPCAHEAHKLPGAKNVIVSEVYRTAIIGSPRYAPPAYITKEEELSPYEQLYRWYQKVKHDYAFSDDDFEVLLERAKTWLRREEVV